MTHTRDLIILTLAGSCIVSENKEISNILLKKNVCLILWYDYNNSDDLLIIENIQKFKYQNILN